MKAKRPVFSCDSGLLIEGLSTQEQPGVHVRVKDGIRMTDGQMTAYYSGIAHRLGGCCRARYQNAVCLILSETKRYEYDGEDIGGEAFYLVDRGKGAEGGRVSFRLYFGGYKNGPLLCG